MTNILQQNIIKELGLETLAPEKQDEAMMTLGKIIYQGILAKVLERLSDDEAKEFDALIAKNQSNPDNDEVFAFLQAKIPDIDKLIANEARETKEKIGEMLNKLK